TGLFSHQDMESRMSDEKKKDPTVVKPQDDHATGVKEPKPLDDHATGAKPLDDHATGEEV
ncbi:hypothetical protein ACFTZG_31035, partial [Streptomyces albidoflavus]